MSINIAEILLQLRQCAKLTQKDVAKALARRGIDVKYYSILRWESGQSQPNMSQFFALCEIYGVGDINKTFTGVSGRQSLLDGLNERGREHAQRYIELLKHDTLFTESEPAKPRSFRLYDLPVSAGTGTFLDGDEYEEITADSLIPVETDYAVRVSGDSMEPRYFDGQILFIKAQETIEDNEIGIFALNGESYVKQLAADSLVSLNPKYKPIPIGENDVFRVLGKVIGAN